MSHLLDLAGAIPTTNKSDGELDVVHEQIKSPPRVYIASDFLINDTMFCIFLCASQASIGNTQLYCVVIA